MSNKDELLGILEAHGKQFLQSFDLPNIGAHGKQKAFARIGLPSSKRAKLSEDELSSEEEWGGIQAKDSESSEDDGALETNEDDSALETDEDEDFEQDDGFTAGGSNIVDDKVIVFSEKSFKSEPADKAHMKAFMSSKISKLRDDGSTSSQPRREKTSEEDEDERTNAENDALLHKLVHTQLLSGSLNPELDLTPAHRRKALAGRLVELAGGARLGKGEKAVREAEKNKAAKRVREGLARKQKEREKQQLEEARNLGNYHPALKRLFEASGGSVSRSRSRGLKMGVGEFRGGVLRLSKQEIASVTGGPQHSSRRRGVKGK